MSLSLRKQHGRLWILTLRDDLMVEDANEKLTRIKRMKNIFRVCSSLIVVLARSREVAGFACR